MLDRLNAIYPVRYTALALVLLGLLLGLLWGLVHGVSWGLAFWVAGTAALTVVGLRDRVRLGASGKVISAFDVARAMALGADWCNSARGFMFALGCIQAQTCHTGHCPTGVTTQDPVRQQALVVPNKTDRVFHFHQNTLKALRELVQAAGLQHPGDIQPEHIVRRMSTGEVRLLSTVLHRTPPGGLLAEPQGWHGVYRLYWARASADQFGLLPLDTA